MIKILWPERRWVTEDWVLTQGFDAKVNDAVEAYVKAHGVFQEPEPGCPDPYDLFVSSVTRPTLDECIEILDDLGLVTFACRGRR